jgi:hypothetical protein
MIGHDPLFGLIGLVVAVMISRIIMERALKRLGPDVKARMVDAFSAYRIYNYAAILTLMVLYFACVRYFPQQSSVITPVFFLLFLVVTGVVSFLSYRKLKALEMPSHYVRSYLINLGIQYLGIGFLFAPIVAKYAW